MVANYELLVIQSCRSCGSNLLTSVIDLGEQYVSDFVTEDSKEGTLAPLLVVECQKCRLVQLKHTVNRKLLYSTYWYESSINKSMRDALKDITNSIEMQISLHAGDYVMDIGANDGCLLRSYNIPDLNTVGVEPAMNLIPKLVGVKHIVNGFFENLPFRDRVFKVITAIAMFYDLEDPNTFVKEVKRLLHPDGLFVIQMNDLYDMINKNTFDNIGHEHLEYYSLWSLRLLLERHGLEIYHLQYNNVNGGSCRYYIQHKGGYRKIDQFVKRAEMRESGINTELKLLGITISSMGAKLKRFIMKEVANGKTIMGYGASNRGNTILQYLDLDRFYIKAIADRNPTKHGRYTVGTRIPIISEEEMRKAKPDYLLILPYHFLDEFLVREKEYLDGMSGKMIVPIPQPRIISKNGVEWL